MTLKREDRLCRDCRNHDDNRGNFLADIYFCTKHNILIGGEMQAIYKESEGTCWEAQEKPMTKEQRYAEGLRQAIEAVCRTWQERTMGQERQLAEQVRKAVEDVCRAWKGGSVDA